MGCECGRAQSDKGQRRRKRGVVSERGPDGDAAKHSLPHISGPVIEECMRPSLLRHHYVHCTPAGRHEQRRDRKGRSVNRRDAGWLSSEPRRAACSRCRDSNSGGCEAFCEQLLGSCFQARHGRAKHPRRARRYGGTYGPEGRRGGLSYRRGGRGQKRAKGGFEGICVVLTELAQCAQD